MHRTSNLHPAHRPDPFARASTGDLAPLRDPSTLAAPPTTPEDQIALGLQFLQGLGHLRDPEQALAWFRCAAEQGNPQAMGRMGALLATPGPGFDAQAARAWLAQAAAADYPQAHADLGRLLLAEGEEAEGWGHLRQAAASEVEAAWPLLARRYADHPEEDPGPEGDWMERTANQGSGDAWLVLARRRTRAGLPGLALVAFRRAAESGRRDAFHEAGILLLSLGRRREGRDWLRSAARYGVTASLVPLARLLMDEGASWEAEELLLRASQEGSVEAMYLRARILMTQGGDAQTARNLLWHAASGGWPEAMFHFGDLLLKGARDPATRAQGLHWLRRAGAAGHPDAVARLAALQEARSTRPRSGQGATWPRRLWPFRRPTPL
jgi:uncharacterized protein